VHDHARDAVFLSSPRADDSAMIWGEIGGRAVDTKGRDREGCCFVLVGLVLEISLFSGGFVGQR